MADAEPLAPKPGSPEASYLTLISLAVHEFRTPASVVGGYLRMLQRGDDPLTERQRKMVDEAVKSCARLVEIVAELSDVGKLDAGSSPLVREPLDFFAVVDAVAASVHDGEGREVRLSVRGPATGAPMRGDAARLRSAIQAIVRAIIREQPMDSTVVLDRRLDERGGAPSAMLIVAREDGVQAAYAAAPAAFDEKRGGLGLSLPIARRIIEAHGGRLWSPAAQTEDADRTARGAAVASLPLELNR